MDFQLKKYYRNISNEEMIEDLKNVANILNQNTVSERKYNEKGKYGFKTIIRRFGSWNKSLQAANLDLTIEMNISEEDLFQNIYDIWEKFGRQPKYKELRKPLSKYSEKPYVTQFGSWSLALEKFIEYINNPSNFNDNEIINDDVQLTENVNDEIKFKHKTKRDPNLRLRFLVMRRDNFKCQMCGRSPANESGVILHIDHIIPWDKGGETLFENLQTLCSVCNIGKSNLI